MDDLIRLIAMPPPAPDFVSPQAAMLQLVASRSGDAASLSSVERQILRLHDISQEQQLERALLMEDRDRPDDYDVEGAWETAIEAAERELLEARASYSVTRKVIENVLMTDPGIRAVRSSATSVMERKLFSLINRRDLLSLVHQNVSKARTSVLEDLSNAEMDSLGLAAENREVAAKLLRLTASTRDEEKDTSWRAQLSDTKMQAELDSLENEKDAAAARYVTLKRIASAAITASGVNWADNDSLLEIVLDDEAESSP